MEPKKISFGFMKTKKAEKPIVEEKRDYIECLEEHSIKIVGGEAVKEDKPLIIPMKPNTLVTVERLKEIAAKVESSLEETEVQKEEIQNNVGLEPIENETLDQMAVRELLQDSKKDVKVEESALTVPVPSKPVIDGQKESTLEDYESIPIQDFGMAMLRGMGWTPNKDQSKYKQPQLRPKGLGLGADKVISENQKKKSNKDNQEDLNIVKNSYVKITTGKYSGYYGKVISMDEDNGRVMVDLTMAKETVNLNEFMMQPVTKAEFDRESKVINSDAYKEYKRNEGAKDQDQKSSRNDSIQRKDKSRHESARYSEREPSSSQNNTTDRRVKEDRREDRSNGRSKDSTRQERSRKDSSSSDDRSRKRQDKTRVNCSSDEDRSRNRKEKPRRNSSSSEDRSGNRKEKPKRDSSSEDRSRSRKEKPKRDSSEDRHKNKKDRHKRASSSSDEKKKKKDKYKKRYSSNDSLSSISDTDRKQKKDKRDIDKKRKGKKKKRDRDRSPNYKKHRK